MALKLVCLLLVAILVFHVGVESVLLTTLTTEEKIAVYKRMQEMLNGRDPVEVLERIIELYGKDDPIGEAKANKEWVETFIDPFGLSSRRRRSSRKVTEE